MAHHTTYTPGENAPDRRFIGSRFIGNYVTGSHVFCSLCALIFLLSLLLAGCGGGEQPTTSVRSSNVAAVVAGAGPIVAARVGESVSLDGSRSTTSLSAPLSYRWSFVYKPETSKAELVASYSMNPGFTADVKGVYAVQLVVTADGISSKRSIQLVVVTADGERLTGAFNHPGLSSNCVSCHDGILVKPGKSPDHMATSNMCEACHTPQSASIIPFVDHEEVFGNCSGCHDGITAIGKSDSHTPTDAECDNCHNTTSFLVLAADGSFDHSNITRGCSGCHNGKTATGKTASILEGGRHPDTQSECSNCHTTASFLNAYPDHSGPDIVGKRCDSCHGVAPDDRPSDPPVGHPVSQVDCDVCHSIGSFNLGGVFNHHVVTPEEQPCQSCHNDSNSINARGKGSALPAHPVTDSDCGACHNTEAFSPALGFDHTGISSGCSDSCHIADGSGIASGKPVSTPLYAHMPTTPDNQDCADCHTLGSFSTGTFDHAGVVDGCNTCHDNRISIGKLANHIPTSPDNQDCADCHDTTDFAAAVFDHSGIAANGCANCHDGTISTGEHPGHVDSSLVLVGLDCSACHSTSTFASFVDTFIHQPGVVDDSCEVCHNTTVAIGKHANHIPSQDKCSACHTDTGAGGFSSSTFLSTLHPALTSGCEGCHVNPIIIDTTLLKTGSHLPTGQDCDTCHSNTAFKPATFDHTGITSDCASCHDGSTNNVAAGARGLSPGHTAINGKDCGVCHNTTDFAAAVFDHTGIINNCASCHGDGAAGAVTKKNPGHVITAQDCSLCHVTGTFINAVFDHTGIVDQCSSCHDGNGAVATVKHDTHIITAQDCSLCHNTTAFAGARFDHQGIVDNCASCHDGTIARGKTPPANHLPTNEDCSLCHLTTGFLPATFDHAGIVDNCIACHDGTFATGKSDGHVATNQDCGICHNTSTFKGAVFNHSGIVDNCISCHDGVTAKGMDAKVNPPHIATALDCHFCHTTATFKGGLWIHDDSSIGRCDDCHNDTGGGATPKSPGHLSTSVQCDVCHSTNGWAPDIFSHDSLGNYPGDHNNDPGCAACHGNTINDTLSWPFPVYAPYCAACHAGDFDRKGDHNGGENGTVEQNKDCAESGCHKVTDRKFD